MGLASLLVKALAVLASCHLTKYMLHDAIYWTRVSVEEFEWTSNGTVDVEPLGLCEPRWSSRHSGGISTTRLDQDATLNFHGHEEIHCSAPVETAFTTYLGLGCNVHLCSSPACDVCAAQDSQQESYGENLQRQLPRNSIDQVFHSSKNIAWPGHIDVSNKEHGRQHLAASSNADLVTGLYTHNQPTEGHGSLDTAEDAMANADAAPLAAALTEQVCLEPAVSLWVANAKPGVCADQESPVSTSDGNAYCSMPVRHPFTIDTLAKASYLDAPRSRRRAAIVEPAEAIEAVTASEGTFGTCEAVGSYIPAAVNVSSAAVEEMLFLGAQDGLTGSAAEHGKTAAAVPSIRAAASGTAAKDVTILVQQNDLADTRLSAPEAGWAPDVQLMTFITPAAIREALQIGSSKISTLGVSIFSLPVLSASLAAILACAAAVYLQWFVSGQAVSLPYCVSKDHRKLDLQITLHKLSLQQAMWFRLLGVSGAAVLGVHRAQQRCKQAAIQAQGTAKFARDLMQRQQKRLQRQHESQIAALQQQLRCQEEDHSLLQQQYAAAQQRHVAELQQQQQDADRQQVAADQQHKHALEQQRQQLQQQWNQESQKHQAKHVALQAREKELAADVRSKADVIAEQRACVASLSQQLIEVKSEKAGLSSDLQQVREQLAIEKSRVGFILHEEQEAKGKAAAVKQQYQMLQDQLSEVRSSNAQLTNEVQHLQAAHAAAESTTNDLQQQLASTRNQLTEARAVGAEYGSKVLQLEERTKSLQKQLSSMQAARDDLTGHLRELQGLHTAAEATNKDLQEKLSAAAAAVADGRANIAQLQEQQKQLEDRAVEHKDRLLKLQGRNQQLQTSLTAAEASNNELRGERQATERKAEQVQQQLSSTLAELGQLHSDHGTVSAQLQQSKEANQQLQEQLAALQGQYKEQRGQLAALQQVLSATQQQLQANQHQLQQAEETVEQLTANKQQLESAAAQQQADLATRRQHIEELNIRLQQEQVTVSDLQLQLKTLSSACTELEENRNLLDQHLEESMQLIEEREADLQHIQEQKAALETELTAVRANLTNRTATLREAQASLSDTEGKLHEEYEKSWELGRENMQLQQELDKVKEYNRQIDQELEDVTSDRDDLVDKLEKLTASYEVLLQESNGIQCKTEGLLAENLDSLVELEGKYTAAQAGLSAVTKERDDLAKRLFWAEIARDQHGAAKNLANEEAIAARKDLLEEKLIKTRQLSPAAPRGTSGGGALHGAGANGLAEDRPALSRTSSRGKAWPEVKTGYLHQQFSDRPPTGRTSSSHSHSSPRSPVHSPTPSADAAMFTPLSKLQGSVLKTGVSPSNSRSSSAPCTPRSGEEVVDGASISSAGSPAGQQLLHQQQHAARQTAGASAAPCSSSRLRRSSSMPLVPDLLLASADEAEPGSVATAQIKDMGVAAAVEGLRRNFSNSSPLVVDGDDLSAEATDKAEGQLDGSCAVLTSSLLTVSVSSERCSVSRDDAVVQQQEHDQLQQQQQIQDSPAKISPPPLESSHSPNIASSGKSGSRNDSSRGSRLDRSLLPLNLSPVPFDLRSSNEVCASSASISKSRASIGGILARSAPGDSSSIADVLNEKQDVPASPEPSKQQQAEEFYTPPPLAGWQVHTAPGGVTPSAAGAAATPYFTPQQGQQSSAAASGHHGVDGPDASPATSCRGVRSLRSTSEMDDEADVLIGSMTESDFAAAVSRPGCEAAGSAAAAVRNSEGVASTGAGLSSDMQRQQQLAAEAAAVARRQQSRLAHGNSSSILQSVSQQETGAESTELGEQQQHQRKLTKNQKKKLRQKQKRQAAAHRQSLQQDSMDASSDCVLTGLVPQQSEEQLADANCEGGASDDDAHAEVHLRVVHDSMEDAPLGRGRADSPPKMFIRGPAATGVQSSGSSAGTGGRYGSPMKGRGVLSTPFVSTTAGAGLTAAGSVTACCISTASSVDDVGSPNSVAAASSDAGLLVSAGSGGSYTGPASAGKRLGPGKLALGSPSRTSCSSIKSLVAQSRLRDAELGSSSSGGSRLGNNSPQRFRTKFAFAADSPLAVAGPIMSNSNESLSLLRHSSSLQRQMLGAGSVDQDSCSAGHPGVGPGGVLTTPGRPGKIVNQDEDDVVRGSVESNQYRSSVHWKALSDSVSLSACELSLVRLGSRGSGAASPAGGRIMAADRSGSAQSGDEFGNATLDGRQLGTATASQEWKVAENMLYFE